MRAATPRHGRQRSPIFSSRAVSGRFFRFEREPRGFLQREVAGRPRVGMAEAEQKEDIRRPGTNAFDRDELLVRFLGRHQGERVDIQRVGDDCVGECAQRADFRRGETGGTQRFVGCVAKVPRIERRDHGAQTAEDRVGAGGRDLLRDDNGGEAFKAGLAPAQRRRSADFEHVPDRLGVLRGERGDTDRERCLAIDQWAGMIEAWDRFEDPPAAFLGRRLRGFRTCPLAARADLCCLRCSCLHWPQVCRVIMLGQGGQSCLLDRAARCDYGARCQN